MSWRNKFNDHDGIGVCDTCQTSKPLHLNASNIRECHECWLTRFVCMDCGINTRIIDEYYTLKDTIWYRANPRGDGMLCIGCLECRLGRSITQDDFRLEVPINMMEFNERFPKSNRLINRLSTRKTWTIVI